MNDKITIKDVAKKAGVSVSIASFALNNVKGRVSEESKQKVMKAVKELGYVPNHNAKRLRSQNTDCIMLVYSQSFLDEQNASTVAFILGIIKYARKMNKDIIFRTIFPSSNWEKVVETYDELWRSRRFDGIIFLPAFEDFVPDWFFSRLYESGVNLVSVSPDGGPKEYPIIYSNNYFWTQKALDYIVEKGYREIYYIGQRYPDNQRPRRIKAYTDYIENNNIKGSVLEYSSIHRDFGRIERLISPIIDKQQNDIAFLCWNDVDAIIVLEVLSVKYPDRKFRIGVMGHDDIPTARHTNPPLTTIKYPFEEVGIQCVNLIMESVQERSKEIPSIEIDSSIIERKSL